MPDDIPTVWRIQASTAGTFVGAWPEQALKTGSMDFEHYVPIDVLHRCARSYELTPVRFNKHRWDHFGMHSIDHETWIGLLKDCRPSDLGVEAVLHLRPHREDVASLFWKIWSEWMPIGAAVPGFSWVVDRNDISMVNLSGTGIPEVSDIRRILYLDLVARPAQRLAHIIEPVDGVKNMFVIQSTNETKLAGAEKRCDELLAQAKDLIEAERELDQQLEVLLRDIEPVKSASGEALLQSVMTGKKDGVAEARGRAVEMMLSLDNVYTAIERAREKRREKLQSYWRVQAEVMRLQAKERLQEAEDLHAKVKVHMDAIAELTGVRPMLTNRDAQSEAYRESRLQELQREAEHLEVGASSKDRQDPSMQRGTIRATGASELIAKLYEDPLELRPRASEVREWIARETGEPAETQLVTKQDLAGTVAYSIHWVNGKIDANHPLTTVTRTRPAATTAPIGNAA